jgi:hypothetical protein
MALRAGVAALLIAAAHTGPAAGREPVTVAAIEPGGPGVLTKCRNWVIATSCKTYHHILLPPRIAVGDKITVRFGTHPKEYAFPVARIAVKGDHCRILGEAQGSAHNVDKIDVTPCRPAEGR